LLLSLAFGTFGFFVAGLHFVEQDIEALEILLPKPAIPLQPNVELLQRRRTQSINSALRIDPSTDKACVAEHPQMFGDLRLPEMEAVDHVADGTRTVAQEFDDVKAVGLCQSFECFEHAFNISN
jgi:hypothetical protein